MQNPSSAKPPPHSSPPAPAPPLLLPSRTPPLLPCRSISYALQNLGTRLVVVMGHTRCGAVKAAVAEFVDQARQRQLQQDSASSEAGTDDSPLTSGLHTECNGSLDRPLADALAAIVDGGSSSGGSGTGTGTGTGTGPARAIRGYVQRLLGALGGKEATRTLVRTASFRWEGCSAALCSAVQCSAALCSAVHASMSNAWPSPGRLGVCLCVPDTWKAGTAPAPALLCAHGQSAAALCQHTTALAPAAACRDLEHLDNPVNAIVAAILPAVKQIVWEVVQGSESASPAGLSRAGSTPEPVADADGSSGGAGAAVHTSVAEAARAVVAAHEASEAQAAAAAASAAERGGGGAACGGLPHSQSMTGLVEKMKAPLLDRPCERARWTVFLCRNHAMLLGLGL